MSAVTLSMTAALLGLVVIPEVLASRPMFDARPLVGIATWYLAGVLGWAGTLSLALRIALAPSNASLTTGLSRFVRHLSDGHPLRGLGLREVVGLSLAFDIVALLIGSWVISAFVIWRHRHEQRVLLDLLATRDDDVRMLDLAQPVAYYLPGSGGRIVISRGTTRVLTADELTAVIEHERGHALGHHSSVLVPLSALTPFVAFLPYARHAHDAVAAYVEMAADDHARRRASTSALRSALEKSHRLSTAPVGSIGWTSAFTTRRIDRLERAVSPLSSQTALIALASVVVPTLWLLATWR